MIVRVRHEALSEVWMLFGLLGGDAAGWIVDKEAFEQIQAVIVETRNERCGVRTRPLWERGLEVGERGDAWPVLLGRGAQDSVDS